MANIVIRIMGITPVPGNAFEVGFELIVEGSTTVFMGSSGEPFFGDPNGINVGVIGAAKEVAASNGFPFGPDDSVLLIGGFVVPSSGPSSQVARVVMQGSTVDSVFVGASDDGGPADIAAQARAAELAAATEGSPQEDALKHAAWIAKAPVHPG